MSNLLPTGEVSFKKGRVKETDRAVMNGLGDGKVSKGNFTMEIKGTKKTLTWVYPHETFIMVYDYTVTKNGPISVETITHKLKPNSL